MRYLIVVFILFNCADKKNTKSHEFARVGERPVRSKGEIPGKDELLGVWTDGSGPNASFRIDEDSIYNVEHFMMSRYTYKDGVIQLYYDDEIYSSNVLKVHPDTIVFKDEHGTTKYWRFTD
jgi:hypothetical protein